MSIESIRGRIKQIVDSEIARCADDVTGRTYKLAISNVWNQIECLPMGDAAIRKDAAVNSSQNPCDIPPRTLSESPSWVDVNSIDEMQDFYMSRLPAIREAAKKCGYAIGLHGSCRRDFDLMAMPWVENYENVDTLAKEIQKAACGFHSQKYTWEKKSQGRIATSMPICWTAEHMRALSIGHIDLSVLICSQPNEIRHNEQLVGDVEEYLHWRKVNPQIKGGENYLKRFRESLTSTKRESVKLAPELPRDCCRKCEKKRMGAEAAQGIFPIRLMVCCSICGNKRCPKASDHDLACTGSNDPNQPGSVYQTEIEGGQP